MAGPLLELLSPIDLQGPRGFVLSEPDAATLRLISWTLTARKYEILRYAFSQQLSENLAVMSVFEVRATYPQSRSFDTHRPF